MNNPYKIPTKDTKQVRVHKDLVKVLERERKKHQRICDMKLGKGKFKVGMSYVSKVLGGVLR